MPTGYTADVADGKVTDVTEFAASCARAFGAFMHQRDDSMDSRLRLPDSPRNSYYYKHFHEAKAEYERWTALDEHGRYCEWSQYHDDLVKSGIQSEARHDIVRIRYNSMIAQVKRIDVPERLAEFKNFMLDQLHESVRYDCPENDDFTKKYYSPLGYTEWVETNTRHVEREVKYYADEINKAWTRYDEGCDYIETMAKTFGFKVEGVRDVRNESG